MTADDYLQVMKTVRIADLKARLSEHLRSVRRGHPLVVLDRDTPIARVVPYREAGEPLVIRQPMGRYPSLQEVPLPAPLRLDVDIVDVLLEERQGER
jgi:prevent-host-death family protein